MSVTDLFYRQLIKSPLSLRERSKISECLASCVKEEKGHEWSAIFERKQFYTKHLHFLCKNGYLSIDLKNKKELVEQIKALPCSSDPSALHHSVETEYLEGVYNLPAVQSLINDSQLYDLVSLYLRAPAHLYNVMAWWQFPLGESHIPSNAQLWHRDRDDFSFLKLFLYCTDVDLDSGPHAFLPKSHSFLSLRQLFPSVSPDSDFLTGIEHSFYSDSDLDASGFDGQRKVWIGQEGTCFFEDTRGLHRAYPPTKKARLMFSMVWTIGPGFRPAFG